jgi:hypothetical protein
MIAKPINIEDLEKYINLTIYRYHLFKVTTIEVLCINQDVIHDEPTIFVKIDKDRPRELQPLKYVKFYENFEDAQKQQIIDM